MTMTRSKTIAVRVTAAEKAYFQATCDALNQAPSAVLARLAEEYVADNRKRIENDRVEAQEKLTGYAALYSHMLANNLDEIGIGDIPDGATEMEKIIRDEMESYALFLSDLSGSARADYVSADAMTVPIMDVHNEVERARLTVLRIDKALATLNASDESFKDADDKPKAGAVPRTRKPVLSIVE